MSSNGCDPDKCIEIDDWADETQVAPRILRNEAIYRKKALKDYETLDMCKPFPLTLNLEDEIFDERPIEIIFQNFQEYPQSIFMFTFEGKRVVGKKYMSDLCLAYGIPITFLFCSQIKAPMLLGLVEREQLTQDGILVYFKPFKAQEKAVIFNHLVITRTTDIYYPYAQLLTEKKFEQSSPEDGWIFNSERGDVFAISEIEQRMFTVRILESILEKIGGEYRPQLYDPGCSSGDFLAHVQKAYPNVITIGQDLSPSMVAEAGKKLDKVYLGDSILSPVDDDSMDVVFFRFLNADVVTTEQAYNLLINLVKKCRPNGFIVILGYTPVLISKAIMVKVGLRFIQATGVSEDKQGVFQYYLLQREPVINDIDYSRITSNGFLYG